MAKQTINIGTAPNDGTGTPLRTSFDYCNLNFTELYTALGGGVGLPGATTQVIFNDGGTNLAGDAGLVYNKTTDALTIGGNVQAASATITGDLTVASSILKVSGGNVGINTASPTNTSGYKTLEIVGTGVNTGGMIRMKSSDASVSSYDFLDNNGRGIFAISNHNLRFGCNDIEQYRIQPLGIFTWYDGAGGTRMTLNSTGLGVGASPAYKLDVLGAGNAGIVGVTTTGQVSSLRLRQLQNLGANTRNWEIRTNGLAYGNLEFACGASQQSDTYTVSMILDSSNRLLVNSTSAFTDLTGSREVKIGDGGMQTLTVASLPAATATNIARGGVGGLVYVGAYNGTGQYGAVVLWTAASATVVSVINGTGSTITFGVSGGFLQITSSLVLTQVTASCIRL
jgi:hypothetical protein